MSYYEIKFPNAANMVKAERAEKLPPLNCYGSNGVTAYVTSLINRDYWNNECGHSLYADLVESLIATMGNSAGWQRAVLGEVTLRLEERGQLYGPYHFNGLMNSRPYYEAPLKQKEIGLYRRDGKPMSEL